MATSLWSPPLWSQHLLSCLSEVKSPFAFLLCRLMWISPLKVLNHIYNPFLPHKAIFTGSRTWISSRVPLFGLPHMTMLQIIYPFIHWKTIGSLPVWGSYEQRCYKYLHEGFYGNISLLFFLTTKLSLPPLIAPY